MKFIAKIIFCTFLYGSLLNAKTCGGNFDEFVSELKIEALEKGHSRKIVDDFFADSSHNPLVIKADRSQGVFLLPFLEFSNRLIADYRINLAKKNLKKFKSTFDNIEDRGGSTFYWEGSEANLTSVQLVDFESLRGMQWTLFAVVALAGLETPIGHSCKFSIVRCHLIGTFSSV